MSVKIEFETANAAFCEPGAVADIVFQAARGIENGFLKNSIRDVNGNRIGFYEVV